MIIKLSQLKEQMKVRGISQTLLAERLGVDKRTVNRWMTGKQTIPHKYYGTLQIMFDFDGSEDPYDQSNLGYPKHRLKRKSFMLPVGVANDLYFLANWMGIKQNELIDMLPAAFKAIGILALEEAKSEIKEIEDLKAKLPIGWGPQNDIAKARYENKKKTAEGGNPFRDRLLISSFMVFKGAPVHRGHTRPRRVDVFDEGLNNIIDFCIGYGSIDVSKIDWSLWTKDNKAKLTEALFAQALVDLNVAHKNLLKPEHDDDYERDRDMLESLVILVRGLLNSMDKDSLNSTDLQTKYRNFEDEIKEFLDEDQLEVFGAGISKTNDLSFIKHTHS